MTRQELQNLVERFIKEGINETSNGSHVWSDGMAEEYANVNYFTEEDMQEIENLLYDDERVAEVEVYEEDEYLTIDCLFWLDYCQHTHRPNARVISEDLDLIVQPHSDYYDCEESDYEATQEQANYYANKLAELLREAKENGVEVILKDKKYGVINKNEMRIV